ncbi:MAG: hypothetical protein RIQ94_159 [Pseudomonadota bacterium]
MDDELAAMRKKKMNAQISKEIKSDVEKLTYNHEFYKKFQGPDELELLRRKKMMDSLAEWKKANPPEPTEPVIESIGGGVAGALIPAAIHYANQATHGDLNPLNIQDAGEGSDIVEGSPNKLISRDPSSKFDSEDKWLKDAAREAQRSYGMTKNDADNFAAEAVVNQGAEEGRAMLNKPMYEELSKIKMLDQLKQIERHQDDVQEPDVIQDSKYRDQLEKGQKYFP